MLYKIKIISSKIPCNTEGYILDIKNSKITNTSRNMSIPLPFKLKYSNLFNFELVINKSDVHLNIIIDKNIILDNFYNSSFIKDKQCIFNLLKTSFKYTTKNHELNTFNKFYDIPNLINSEYSNILKNNIIKLGNSYFNLNEERIYNENYDNLVYIRANIYFVYGNIYNLYSIPKYTLCIIDDLYKFDNSNIVIQENNYDNIDINNIDLTKNIFISKSLFFSKKYIDKYKLFHSSHRNKYAYDNYKLYTESNNLKISNIELCDNIIFLVKNVNKNLIKSHPFIHSNNKIIIVNSLLTKNELDHSYNILNKKYKNINVNINSLLFKQSFLDQSKHYLHNLYKKSKTVIFKLLHSNVETFFTSDSAYIKDQCPIMKEPIGNNIFIKLSCNHKYIYDSYFSITNQCPYCCKEISDISIRFTKDHLKILFNTNDINNIVFVYKHQNNLIDFFEKIGITIIKIDENISIDFDSKTLMVFDSNINIYDFVNIKPNNLRCINPEKILIFNYQ